jgi:hypothetical protein
MVILHKKEFCEQVDAPITLRDARLFWVLSILQAWVPLLILTLIFAFTSAPDTALLRDIREATLYSLFVPIPIGFFTLFGVLLFFTFASGMPSYFCHPRSLPIERQNRAVALSYFASAPIAFMPMIIALLGAADLLYKLSLFSNGMYFLAALGLLLMFGTWYVRTVGIVLTLSNRRRRKLTIVVLTLFWLSMAALCLVILPLGMWYAAAAIYTLY